MEEAESNKSNKAGILALAITGVMVVGGGIFLLNQSQTPTQPNRIEQPAHEVQVTEIPASDSAAIELTEGEIKEFTISARDFEFDMAEMRVNVGDTVRITLVNEEGMHDWVIDEFDARTEILQTGEEETIEFVADTPGTFEYYCSVMSHRQMGMVGSLIVEE